MTSTAPPEFDAVVIGAGVSGLYQLHRLREVGFSAIVLEAGSDVGGTWYWNRYPGARFDSESYSYTYSFSEELLEEWSWSEHFAAQPETLRYLRFVADKFDLRRDIRFDTRIATAAWDDENMRWAVVAEDGFEIEARYLITAMGPLSAPVMPVIDGVDSFEGEAHHTARWPHEHVSFDEKRVGVIGTGATGVQVISEVAKTAGHLTVFQRSPNWCAPLNNGPISDEEQAEIKSKQSVIFRRCNDSYGGFIHDSMAEKAIDTSDAQRREFWEKRYHEPGFGIWFGNYRDVLVSPAANQMLTDFIAGKIRERVEDPAVAELLIPTDHGFGTRRVPMETGYYEVYNQPNVELVDIRRSPITRITPTGIETTEGHRALDLLIFATGFDAVTGAFDRVEFRGTQGMTLKEAWGDGPQTVLGVATPGFPNMFTLVGPHNAATFCNMPRCIEQNVDWVTDLLAHCCERGDRRVEATPDAAEAWTTHVHETVERLLLSKVDSWFNGVNHNLTDHPPRVLIYGGGLPLYRERCDAEADSDYPSFIRT